MRNDRVLIPFLHVTHHDKCFCLVYTRIFIVNYPTINFIISQKYQRLGCMSKK